MGKFKEATLNIYKVFDSQEWKDLDIVTQPENYKGVTGESILVYPVFSGGTILGATMGSISGTLIVDIFVEATKGPMRGYEIAALLDKYFVAQSLVSPGGSVTQMGRSTLQSLGTDSANPTLYRFSYSISFNHFGVN